MKKQVVTRPTLGRPLWFAPPVAAPAKPPGQEEPPKEEKNDPRPEAVAAAALKPTAPRATTSQQ
jgi:hypothetical protein